MTARARPGSPTGDELAAAWAEARPARCILEALVDFDCEISAIVARGLDGDDALLPDRTERPSRRHPAHHHRAVGPAGGDPGDGRAAAACSSPSGLDLVGLVALEMFVTRDGRVLANEMAPRPHNSGHWTIDACATSQFEQLVRAICGLPLGAVDVLAPSRMENLIGEEADDWPRYRRRSDGAAASLRQGQGAARPQDGPRHLLAARPEPNGPVQDFTLAFSFSIRMTSSMRRSRKPQVASLPGERSFSQ